jgi:serine/threonine protein kinase
MTPEQYQQIGALYHKALKRSPDERAAYLAEACAGDEELRRQVEALLVAHEQAREFLVGPDLSLLNPAPDDRKPIATAGQRFGQFEVISLLGAGGMGEVYLARDTRLARPVALKLRPAAYTRDAARVRRFKQEARAASATNHPNILTILDIGEVPLGEGVTHYIAAEYIDGQTLRGRLLQAPMPPREALDVAGQAAAALAAAHKAGIVHRDLKPENVMIRRDGYVKVLDFGLAKLRSGRVGDGESGRRGDGETRVAFSPDLPLSHSPTPSFSTPGMVMGTFAYMSPEQARGEEVDGRSDIFSLGAVLYEMISGRVPFDGKSPADVMAAVLSHEIWPLTDVPAELERIVRKALAKDREQRYQTAKDLLIDLKNLKLELEIAARLKPAAQGEAKAERKPEAEPRTWSVDHIPDVAPVSALLATPPSNSPALREMLEPVGGAVPLDSGFYILRPTDEKFRQAISRQDSIVLVKGARQVGKTSLLARGLQQAREAGAQVVLTDFQSLSAEYLESIGQLLLTLANAFADQLDLDVSPDEVWKPNRSPGVNFEQYLRREALLKLSAPIVWGLDEIDRLFTCDFGGEVFGLFRSWHNKRALDPAGPWQRLTLAIAYATEAHLFITDLNQSPFNVGTRLQLEDFTFEQVAELNERYGAPLKDKAEIARYYRLLSGHPYLVRRGLHEMVTNGLGLTELEAGAVFDEGPFGDHLHRLLISLNKDAELCDVVRAVLQGKPCRAPESFYRLRSAGLAIGESTRDIRPRCQLYATYLERHLL